MFARNGARAQRQFARNRGPLPGDFLTGCSVKSQNPLGVVVETLARCRQEDSTSLATKQRHVERLLKTRIRWLTAAWVSPRALAAAVKLLNSGSLLGSEKTAR